jgi:hypothetical protein
MQRDVKIRKEKNESIVEEGSATYHVSVYISFLLARLPCMSTSYVERAAEAARVLTSRWFNQQLVDSWVPGEDYWKTPAIAAELVTNMRLSGTAPYGPLVSYVRQRGEPWLATCKYLDDATAWGAFHLTTYDWLPAGGGFRDIWRANAETAFGGLWSTWDDRCGGGLYWRRPGYGDDSENIKAMNSTLGLMQMGLGLHRITRGQVFLDAANQAWAWIQGSGLIDADGLVWGGYNPQCQRAQDNPPVVALQGNPLQPLWWLYQLTGDPALLDLAQRIVDATVHTFTWPGTQTLKTGTVDGQWATEDSAWRLHHQNQAMFKGVFCGFMGPFTASLATVPGRQRTAARYAVFVCANADALTANFPGGMFSMDWHTPAPGYTPDADAGTNAILQYSGLAALNAAAAVAHLPTGTPADEPAAVPAASA